MTKVQLAFAAALLAATATAASAQSYVGQEGPGEVFLRDLQHQQQQDMYRQQQQIDQLQRQLEQAQRSEAPRYVPIPPAYMPR
jgi:50S ribosomal subunit-associated GTPase HflX